MNEKHREVSAWLQEVFGSDPVPQYEISSFTVGVLHDLMLKNRLVDRQSALILEDRNQKTEEYAAEAERIHAILERLQLTPDTLSKSGTVSLKSLVSTSCLLQVHDASTTNLLLGLSELNQKTEVIADARKREHAISNKLFEKTKNALLRYSNLIKTLNTLEEENKKQGPDLNNKAKQAGFLQSKGREYRSHIKDLQRELTSSGVDSSLHHSTLCKQAEDLKELKEKLQPLKAKLDSYHQLPPDYSLAKIKLEETKRELAVLEKEISERIDLMHM